MTLSQDSVIASAPVDVYRALLNPDDLSAWWGCDAVIDARIGGLWVGGWGKAEGELGHQTVLWAEISRLEKDKALAFKIGETEISFVLAADPAGCKMTVSQAGYPPGAPDQEQAAFQSWVDMVASLKAWAEENHKHEAPAAAAAPAPVGTAADPVPLTQPKPAPSPAPAPVAEDEPPPIPAPTASPAPSPAPVAAGAEPAGADPYGAAGAVAKGEVRVLDDGGFGVTDPHGVIKSWSKEQGFGYVTHATLGDIVFDYDGCDFEPAPGDKVLVLVIAKSWNGQPKVKRIACPAKGSNINK